VNISVDVGDGERLLGALRGVAADLSELRPGWRAVSDEVYAIERAQFRSLGARGPVGKWRERARSTIDRYASINRRGFAVLNETLRRTDSLFKAVTTRGAPHGVYEEGPDGLTMGFDLAYGMIHQKGGGKVPQRKVYDLTEQDARRLGSILKRGLAGKIKDRGFDFVDGGEFAF
jgi:hypothetical protein